MASLRGFVFGLLALAFSPACTTFDDLAADSVGGAAGSCFPKCGTLPAGTGCKSAADCASGICGADAKCTEASLTDGVKNGNESDIDCGGGGPKCVEGKSCREGTDCVWGFCTGGVCEGHKPGRKDGDQTDIDCGGTMSPACDWGLGCLVDTDCTTKVCGADKKCLTGPSCRVVHGGSTCGTGEFKEPGKEHESCCKSLVVDGFTDDQFPGKKVYLDKYEITAGRMRAFFEAMAGARDDGAPNVKAWMAEHRPAKNWNDGWEETLPSDYSDGTGTFQVANPTQNKLYPGQDLLNALKTPGLDWVVTAGSYTVDTGIFHMVGADHFFPEYSSPVPPWPSGDYAATHNLNCENGTGSYGYGTFWFDNDTIATYSGGVGKKFSKDDMDEKALNCTPFGLFAAFCAWDGGQLVTAELFDYVAGGPWPANSGGTPAPVPDAPPRLAGGNTNCANDTLNTFSDGTLNCPNVYFYPDDQGADYDGSSRIAPPGRVPADTVVLNAGDEPWMDLKGNLQEAVLAADGTFSSRGYGAGWSSISAHRAQITTARMKAGAFGARCMRFK